MMRDVEQIVSEFEADDQPYAVFTDNNLGSKPEYLRKLCQALRPLQKIWSAAVSIDVTDDPTLVREMALAGCTGVFVGFESLNDSNISEANKKSPSTEDYARRVQLLHEHGIQVNGSFVFGFDHDGAGRVQHNNGMDRAPPLGMRDVSHHDAVSRHALVPPDGIGRATAAPELESLRYRACGPFNRKRMSVEQLAEGYERCYRRIFSHASIWKRRPSDWRSVPPYLAMSLSVQTLESVLARVDSPSADIARLAATGGNDATTTYRVSPATDGAGPHTRPPGLCRHEARAISESIAGDGRERRFGQERST